MAQETQKEQLDSQVQDQDNAVSEASAEGQSQGVGLEQEPEVQEPGGVEDLEQGEEPAKSEKIERILSMKVPVIVKVAEKKIALGKVIRLNIGSIIQFDKDAYQHIELMVNNNTIGLGQPIKIGENFGLRITQIGDIADTIKSLGATTTEE